MGADMFPAESLIAFVCTQKCPSSHDGDHALIRKTYRKAVEVGVKAPSVYLDTWGGRTELVVDHDGGQIKFKQSRTNWRLKE